MLVDDLLSDKFTSDMQSGMERMSQIPIDKETQIKAMVSRGRGVTQN